jgi:hypothetical protein
MCDDRELPVATIKLRLDDKTLEKVKHIAGRRRATVETLIQELIERLVAIDAETDPLLGMFAQEPDLIDAVVASTMQARETDPLRVPSP